MENINDKLNLVKETHKQIDEIAEMLEDKNISEEEKLEKINNFQKELGALPNMMSTIMEMRNGPSFKNKN